MKKNTLYISLIVLAVAAVATAAIFTQSGQYFQGMLTSQTYSTTTSSISAPVALSSTLRMDLYTKALKLANFPTATIPLASNMKVTPIAPHHSSGAEIKLAGPMSEFRGATSTSPDGSYTLTKSDYTYTEIRIPTEVSKLYVLDCKVQPSYSKVNVIDSGHYNYPAVENGHVLHAFQASSATTTIRIFFEATAQAVEGGHVGYFYGCEVTKVN